VSARNSNGKLAFRLFRPFYGPDMIRYSRMWFAEGHFHTRCFTHANLQIKLLRARKNPEARAEYNRQLDEHHLEVKSWRELEIRTQRMALSNPEVAIVLSYDDMGIPRFTNRAIKGLSTATVKFVPLNLTNHGTGENLYIYHLKKRWSKFSDRMCSVLYFIRRIKCKVNCNANELAQKKAPKLILMADNDSENKNNILFQFLSELVMRGWFDEIEMMFGPVGHTHNGNDAVHRGHNQGISNHMSYCMAKFFQNYKHS